MSRCDCGCQLDPNTEFEELKKVAFKMRCSRCGKNADGKWHTRTLKNGGIVTEMRCKKHETKELTEMMK